MKNQEITKIFYEIADYLEMEGVAFKSYAYQKAAITLETLEEDVKEIYKRGGLEALKEIPGVGESIAEKIKELIEKGKIGKNGVNSIFLYYLFLVVYDMIDLYVQAFANYHSQSSFSCS